MTNNFSWQQHANCKTAPTDMFYPPPEELKLTVAEMRERAAEARVICDECLVKRECLDYAIENETDGFWGGMTPRQRQKERGHKELKFKKRRASR